MPLKKTIKAKYLYAGEPDGFYRSGEEYYITVTHRRMLWRKYLEVTCLRGGKDQLYEGCTPIVYGSMELFDADWELVSPQL